MDKKLTADLNVVANSNLEIELLNGDLNIIQKLDDEPNDVGGLTSAQLKAKFDESGNIIKEYINKTLIPAVLSEDATEEGRKEAETQRETNETARQAHETARQTAETERVTAEQGRTSAERERAAAENSRAEAETARQSAEQARADENTGIVARATAQANAAAGSAENAAASAQAAQEGASTASSQAAAAGRFASSASASETAAAESAASASNASTAAQSWAVGGTGTRDGEDTNNAKYWSEQAKSAAGGDFATKAEAQGYVDTHNLSSEAHSDIRDALSAHAAQHASGGSDPITPESIGAAPGGYGLGSTPKKITDWNQAKVCGWYWSDIGTANAPDSTIECFGRVDNEGSPEVCIQEVWGLANTNKYYHWIRLIYPTTGQGTPWEWVNPPMAVGVEYRTTERYQGKPVYTKLISFGSLPNNAYKDVAHNCQNLHFLVLVGGDSNGDNLIDNPYIDYILVGFTNIRIKTNTDRSATTARVVIKYTKSTD